MSGRVELPSGMWTGHYEQMGRAYPQHLKLEFADGLIRGDGVDDLGTFAIDGEYRLEGSEMRMGWIKTYDGAHSVLYLGELLDRTIRGRWSLTGASGTFALAPADRGGAGGEMS
jgi:hypothetical protein